MKGAIFVKTTIFQPKNIFMILLGNAAMALGIVMFVLPNKLMTGGSTGLSLIFEHYFHLPISIFVLIFNCIMFLLGGIILGKDFAITTLLSTFFYPIALGFFQKFPSLSSITDDRLLASLFGGLFIGFSLGIVIRSGASTGGMDIPPLILNKKFGLPVSVMLYVFDTFILLGQVLFSDKEALLYGIILIMTYTIVLDKILVMGRAQTQVKIISKKSEEINRAITQQMDRGSTLLPMESGYLHENQTMVLTVISNRELPRLNQLITSIDPAAFLIINKVNEVHGKGFTLPKRDHNE
ncbi:MAG: YitT family protein [Candidatus Ruminococcus intestinipullorum]|nr:YitT family protein [Candidatus Ruminococcus intestinipullorum]